MTRLRHSLAGLLRYIQISRNGLFVIVEGKKTDPFFYSRLIGPICAAAGISYDIVYGNSVEGLGGKSTLIGLYEGLESNKLLARRDGNLDKRCLFYLDKDVDDVMHKLIRSPHVVYTPFHCVENALFKMCIRDRKHRCAQTDFVPIETQFAVRRPSQVAGA